jgi:hypothetical protein
LTLLGSACVGLTSQDRLKEAELLNPVPFLGRLGHVQGGITNSCPLIGRMATRRSICDLLHRELRLLYSNALNVPEKIQARAISKITHYRHQSTLHFQNTKT